MVMLDYNINPRRALKCILDLIRARKVLLKRNESLKTNYFLLNIFKCTLHVRLLRNVNLILVAFFIFDL